MIDDCKTQNSVGVKEAARILGINQQTVRKWIWRGKLPAFKIRCSRGFRLRVLVDQLPASLREDLGTVETEVECDDQDDLQRTLPEAIGDVPAPDLTEIRRKYAMAETELAEASQFVTQMRGNVDRLRHLIRYLQAYEEAVKVSSSPAVRSLGTGSLAAVGHHSNRS